MPRRSATASPQDPRRYRTRWRRVSRSPAVQESQTKARSPRTTTVGSFPACCARAVSGYATAATLRSVTNSRRLIASPRAHNKGVLVFRLYTNRGLGEFWQAMGCPMSQLGHSRPTHLVPVPINVRCYSDSDITVRRSEVTVRASSGSRR
jgi:hypothetical protein